MVVDSHSQPLAWRWGRYLEFVKPLRVYLEWASGLPASGTLSLLCTGYLAPSLVSPRTLFVSHVVKVTGMQEA